MGFFATASAGLFRTQKSRTAASFCPSGYWLFPVIPCTLTSIFRSLFRFDFGKGQKLKNAHIIIFDTNGEYKDAFSSSKDRDISQKDKDELSLINAYYYGGENEVKVPYWYMNWNELKALVKPSEGSQAPVLNRAIGLAKNKIKSKEQLFIPGYMEEEVNQLLTSKTEDIKKRTCQPARD